MICSISLQSRTWNIMKQNTSFKSLLISVRYHYYSQQQLMQYLIFYSCGHSGSYILNMMKSLRTFLKAHGVFARNGAVVNQVREMKHCHCHWILLMMKVKKKICNYMTQRNYTRRRKIVTT